MQKVERKNNSLFLHRIVIRRDLFRLLITRPRVILLLLSPATYVRLP